MDHSRSQSQRIGVLCLAIVLGIAGIASATDYYVSSSGNDSNAGTSASRPWRTFTRLNDLALEQYDRVFLTGTVAGTLSFTSLDKGPITVLSSGAPATISGNVSAYNTAGITLKNLKVDCVGGDVHGIGFYHDLPSTMLSGITLEDVEVTRCGKNGVDIGSWNGLSGFANVTASRLNTHHNTLNGFFVWAQTRGAHNGVTLTAVKAAYNSGSPTFEPNSGSGILVSGAKNVSIEHSMVYENGASGNGGEGAWVYDCDTCAIRYSESHHNKTNGPVDGNGFGLDGGVINSVLEHNYSHDNDGAGILLCQYPGARSWGWNIVRYNISINDGRKNHYPALDIWNGGPGLGNADIYGNQLIITPLSTATYLIRFKTDNGTDGFTVRDNMLTAVNGALPYSVAPGQANLTIENNPCWKAANFTNQEASVCQP